MTFAHGAVRLCQESLEAVVTLLNETVLNKTLTPSSSNFKDEHSLQIQSKMRKLQCCCFPGPYSCLIFAPNVDI